MTALSVGTAGLGGLKTWIYILQCFYKGQSRKQIVKALNGDEELVDVWISFLMQYDWIEQHYESDEWTVTLKGREWYEKNTILN